MIVGRVVYAGGKLALSNQWKNTALWEMRGVTGPVDVEDHCYLPMDRLLERQRAIQRTLASKTSQERPPGPLRHHQHLFRRSLFGERDRALWLQPGWEERP